MASPRRCIGFILWAVVVLSGVAVAQAGGVGRPATGSAALLCPHPGGSASLAADLLQPASTPSGPRSVAATDPATDLVLQDGRFVVHLLGPAGDALPFRLSEESGYFRWSESGDIEAVVKVLDKRAVNGHYWVYVDSRSENQLTVEVEQLGCGATPCSKQTYLQPGGSHQNFLDVIAFGG